MPHATDLSLFTGEWYFIMSVTRDEIRTAFLCLLFREPESEDVYDVFSTSKDAIQLRQIIMRGAEFRRRMTAIREAEQRDALFFLHLEKTGGSSVFDMLARNFRPDQVAPGHYGFRDKFDMIESRFDFYAGHFDYDLVSQVRRRSKKMLSVFRRPVDRLISSYRFARAQPTVPANPNEPTFLAKNLSPEDFFSHPLVRSAPTLNNYYLRTFASSLRLPIPADWSADDDRDLLETAQSRIRSLDAIGLTHRMTESVLVICSALGLPPPKKILAVNKTDALPNENPKFHRVPPVDMSPALTDALRDLVHYDNILFDTASEEFERRLASVQPRQPRELIGTNVSG